MAAVQFKSEGETNGSWIVEKAGDVDEDLGSGCFSDFAGPPQPVSPTAPQVDTLSGTMCQRRWIYTGQKSQIVAGMQEL